MKRRTTVDRQRVNAVRAHIIRLTRWCQEHAVHHGDSAHFAQKQRALCAFVEELNERMGHMYVLRFAREINGDMHFWSRPTNTVDAESAVA